MTKREKQQLLKQIASIAEKAYRRGFQQGQCAALGKYGTPPSEVDVAKWRFANPTLAVGPPGTLWAGRKADQIERLKCELQDHDAIKELVNELSDPSA